MASAEPAKLLVSTRNDHKLREIHAIMVNMDLNLISLAEFPDSPEVIEDLSTLEGNAAKKAKVLHAFASLPTMADDTGLEVLALDGAPGVHSARYAGEDADDSSNRALLLKNMEHLEHPGDRRAQFRTVIALTLDSGTYLFEGACKGRITLEERGEGGFGYDSIFEPQGLDKTFAELSSEEKNQISHRGRALERFAAYMSVLLDERTAHKESTTT